MKQKTNKVLYAYWNEVRGSRIAPRRFEIEPARIGSILPETFILERIDDVTYHYRLSGTRIFEEFGIEFRSSNFLDQWSAVDRLALQRQLKEMSLRGGIAVINFTATAASGDCVTYESILLPLIHTNATIDRFVGAVSAINAPSWLGRERLSARTLIDSRIIWPNGSPEPVDELDVRQAPFLPHIRGARLVRSERRQFRVYDGGLSKNEPEDR